MRKTPSLFKRDYEGTRLVYDEVVEGSEWVTNGEGVATIKWDGTACMVRDGKLYKRYDAKQGRKPPADFEPAQDPDPITGHWAGWIPVGDGPDDRWHREAFDPAFHKNGTYELIGPKIQGNPHRYDRHVLIPHGEMRPEPQPPRTFDDLKEWLATHMVEGIVWHHPDGRMVKIKRRDFGLSWPLRKTELPLSLLTNS